jgi:hypothetical protein
MELIPLNEYYDKFYSKIEEDAVEHYNYYNDNFIIDIPYDKMITGILDFAKTYINDGQFKDVYELTLNAYQIFLDLFDGSDEDDHETLNDFINVIYREFDTHIIKEAIKHLGIQTKLKTK